MRVEELLNTKPLVAKGDNAASSISQATATSTHVDLAEAADKLFEARKPYKPYKPYTTEVGADSTARMMRLKEFLLRYHIASPPAPIADRHPRTLENLGPHV